MYKNNSIIKLTPILLYLKRKRKKVEVLVIVTIWSTPPFFLIYPIINSQIVWRRVDHLIKHLKSANNEKYSFLKNYFFTKTYYLENFFEFLLFKRNLCYFLALIFFAKSLTRHLYLFKGKSSNIPFNFAI